MATCAVCEGFDPRRDQGLCREHHYVAFPIASMYHLFKHRMSLEYVIARIVRIARLKPSLDQDRLWLASKMRLKADAKLRSDVRTQIAGS